MPLALSAALVAHSLAEVSCDQSAIHLVLNILTVLKVPPPRPLARSVASAASAAKASSQVPLALSRK